MSDTTITLTNCKHLDAGWCLGCVRNLVVENERLRIVIAKLRHALELTDEAWRLTTLDMERLKTEIERLKADAPYAAFGRKVFDEIKECIIEGAFHCDAEELAKLAVECGLMQHVPFDPAKHDQSFFDHEYEPGDMIYFWGGSEEEGES